MDRTASPTRPVTARLLAVCAMVFALFLMHGMPTAAAGGCHAAMAARTPMPQSPPPVKVSHAGTQAAGHFADASHMTAAGLNGTLCVATPAHQRPSAPVGAAAVVGFAGCEPPGRRFAAGGTRWRGPPGGGRGVLLRVCVART